MALPQLQHAISRRSWSVFTSSNLFTAAQGTLSGAAVTYFASQIGQVAAGYPAPLTLTETNLRTAGMLSAQQGFVCHAVAFKLTNAAAAAPVSAADFHTVYDGAYAQFQWGSSTTDIAPLGLIGSGGDGAFGVAGTVGATAAELNGGAGGVWKFASPVVFPALATFSIRVQYPQTAMAVKGAVVTSCVGRFTLIGELTSLTDAS